MNPLFRDQSKESASRLQRLWAEEQENAKKDGREPSFGKACFRFCRTRIIISSLFFIGAVILQFLAPVSKFNHLPKLDSKYFKYFKIFSHLLVSGHENDSGLHQ